MGWWLVIPVGHCVGKGVCRVVSALGLVQSELLCIPVSTSGAPVFYYRR